MKASRFLGNKTFAVTDLPTPHAGPGELVLRNQVCGVCLLYTSPSPRDCS